MKSLRPLLALATLLLALACAPGGKLPVDHGLHNPRPEDALVVNDETTGGGPWTIGTYGGAIVYPTIGDPKSFNWVVNNDQSTSDVGRVSYADLIAINKFTQRPEPEVAKSFAVAEDKRSMRVTLRRGLRWSDGEPFSMDDVRFTWRTLWNPHVSTPARDSLGSQDENGEERYFHLEFDGPEEFRLVAPRPYAILDRSLSEIWLLPAHEFAPQPAPPDLEREDFVLSPASLNRLADAASDRKIYWEVWFLPELKRLGRLVAEGADQAPENLAKLAAFDEKITAWDRRMAAWASEFSSAWSTDLATDPASAAAHFCTLGAFRIGQYFAGQHLVLVPNPFYWKYDAAGNRLPYLDKLYLWTVQNQDTMMVKFASGEGDILSPVLPTDVAALKRNEAKAGYTVREVGPRLQDNHLYCIQHRGWRATLTVADSAGKPVEKPYYRYPGNPAIADRYYENFAVEVKDPALLARLRAADFRPIVAPNKAAVFQNVWFRRALSSLVDREAIVENIFAGLAVPLYGSIGPGYKDWYDPDLPKYPYAPAKAAEYLDRAGLERRGPSGFRLGPDGRSFSLTFITNTGNEQRAQIGSLMVGALRKAGIDASFQPVDFNVMLTKKQSSFDFDCIISGLGGGDVDQAANGNVYLTKGFTHVWAPRQPAPMTPEEAEIDRLFDTVATGATLEIRVAAMHRIETIMSEQQFYIHTYANTLFVASRNDIGNFQPALMEQNALWNVGWLYRRK